ncbi:flagellin N-terminal helical domain-containing protein [Pseudoduganella aquatica]|uniref:Flagellin n=1 Tax=Pseudoduganella aquatica TaxID=2660641 RepID=A0A7X4HCM0_9BURK|nr:flagellin [Pseudoduganella aquatica]MYN07877.1 Lateral flagellin [Pseudoduganella aquatica]
MLSLHTSQANLAALNATTATQRQMAVSATRLATGYRINSAMDDAAGLQIATRLKAQSSGMKVAMRNIQNSISQLQSVETLYEGIGNNLQRMLDLATQAADGSYSEGDRAAMQAEYDGLAKDNSRAIWHETVFGESGLFPGGTFTDFDRSFQIGSDASERFIFQFDDAYEDAFQPLTKTSVFNAGNIAALPVLGDELLGGNAGDTIDKVNAAIDGVAAGRSIFGSVSNRLEHAYANLQNISLNTTRAEGRFMDADFAQETAVMTASQMLMQSGTAMLKQSSSVSSLIISLLQ